MKICINISAKQLEEENFNDVLKEILVNTSLDSRFVEFEITEHIIMRPKELIIKKMNQLREIGISFSIDDFGVGYSSLGYLRDFTFDTLKIDRSFIGCISLNIINNHILEAIIELGKKLNMTIIAEGVETIEELEFLKSKNVKEIQGYLFSRPAPLNELKFAL